MAEWLKAHDSKSCGLQSLGGSNPLASATSLTRRTKCEIRCRFAPIESSLTPRPNKPFFVIVTN